MYTGSMRGMGAVPFAVWGYVVAHAVNGSVELNPELIAFLIGEPIEAVNSAIEKFTQPDPRSRSKEQEGRRLLRVGEFLYEVVNHLKYQKVASNEQRKEKTRERTRKWREKRTVTHGDASDATQNQIQTQIQNQYKKELEEENSFEQRFPDPSLRAVAAQVAFHVHSRVALWYLNEKSARHFRETTDNLQPISTRLNEEGVDIDGVKLMIDRQIARWNGTKFQEYLRPLTLFGEKFDSYYATRKEPVTTNRGDTPASAPRNRGTFNEGQAKKYNLSAIQKNRQLPPDEPPGRLESPAND
jgi:uncharacterized phage protein (TIGR02220 family)